MATQWFEKWHLGSIKYSLFTIKFTAYYLFSCEKQYALTYTKLSSKLGSH